jgi:hypothetical protein
MGPSKAHNVKVDLSKMELCPCIDRVRGWVRKHKVSSAV